MDFVDEVTIEVAAGDGGAGCTAFRREKYNPLGGPSGGDGGDGGDIVFVAHDRLTTLLDLRYKRVIQAKTGERGRGKDQFGKAGSDTFVPVPVGTQIYDADSGLMLTDLNRRDAKYVIAEGGKGGRGNMRFATPQDRAPRRADPGEPGERKRIRMELKLLADVGVVGFPNVGKSTFIAAVSKAKPKIADYPFTTLTPNLGVTSLGDERSFVIADIPGIIEGASEGAGLGLRFLRHVERNRVLLHVITFDPDPERDPIADFDKLIVEMGKFDSRLNDRPMVVGVSKTDLPEVQERLPAIEAAMKERGYKILPFSAATRQGLEEVLQSLEIKLAEHPVAGAEPAPTRLTAADRPHDHQNRPDTSPANQDED